MIFPLRLQLLLVFVFISFTGYSQNKEEVLEQGKLLYKSEKASWNGTDLLVERFKAKTKIVGGYFSYTENNRNINVFYNRDTVPQVIVSFSFDDSYLAQTAKIDTVARNLTDYEKSLYTIRKKAMDELKTNEMFEFYNGTNFNPVPIIYKGKKMVYFFTGPQSSNVVIFGNDYLVTFNEDDSIQSVKKLHDTIIPLNYSDNPNQTSSLHNHNNETSDIITATDICTLMLYSPYTYWENHYVLSTKYVSVWDCVKNELRIIDRATWEKAMKPASNNERK